MRDWQRKWAWFAAWAPLFFIVVPVLAGLRINPVESLIRDSGYWALCLLGLTLCMSPLRWMTQQSIWVKQRRLLGLSAFAYALCHALLYLILEQGGDLAALWHDIGKRPFITVGMAAWCGLLLLALTSNQRSIRWLKRRWQQLHYVVYPASALAVLHYAWLVKRDLTQPILFAAGLALLLLIRFYYRVWRPKSAS